MLRVKNLSKSYGNKIVLKNVNLKLEKGFWGLIGRNGAGKTTLLRCIMAMTSFSGTIEINGKNVQEIPRSRIAKIVGYVPQLSSQDVPLSIRDFLEIGAYYRDGDVNSIINYLDFEEERQINTLSGGEFQKLLIARAMIGEPPLLLLDEPANHLDIKNTAEIIEILKEYSKRNLVIAVLHDLNLLNFVDGVIAIKNGTAKIFNNLDSRDLKEIFDINVELINVGRYRFVIPRYNGFIQKF